MTAAHGMKIGAGAGILFVMTAPAAYVLMLGVLVNFATGWPLWVGVVLGTLLSIAYVFRGGLRAVVATDVVQFFLMFLAFLVLKRFRINTTVGHVLIYIGILSLVGGGWFFFQAARKWMA